MFVPGERCTLPQRFDELETGGLEGWEAAADEAEMPRPEEAAGDEHHDDGNGGEIEALEKRRAKTRDLKQAMMQEHMKKMETHMSNIEDLLKQLVELQKQ